MIRSGCPRDEFDFMEVIGAGSFGSVHRAIQKSTQKVVAIKIMKRKFTCSTECDLLLECKILRLLPPHMNIVKNYDTFFAPSNELYFVMEYMNGGNLYQLIKEKRDNDIYFTTGELRDIMRQTLAAVSHLHSNHIFHRDLKPENLLLSTCTGLPIIKLADFGLARETSSCPPYTEYVSTRWYRAPEVLLRSSNYSYAVDLWAIGTIFAELISRHPLFPGESEIDQLYRICQVLGSPGNKFINTPNKKKNLRPEKKVSPGFARRKTLDTSAAPSITDLSQSIRQQRSNSNTASTISLLDGGGVWREGVKLAHRIGFEFPHLLPQPLASVIPEATPIMLDLLRQFLFFNPSQRLKAPDALQHPFFLESDNEPLNPTTIQTPIAISTIPSTDLTTTAQTNKSEAQDKEKNTSIMQSRESITTVLGNADDKVKDEMKQSSDRIDSLSKMIPSNKLPTSKCTHANKTKEDKEQQDTNNNHNEPSSISPPYSGKRRPDSTDTIMMDDTKLRKTDAPSPHYFSSYSGMEVDSQQHDDQIHTHRHLIFHPHDTIDEVSSMEQPPSNGDYYHQDDGTSSSSRGPSMDRENTDWMWLKVL
ncbi:kinase-like domain-containing protein [Halteromyces radiatus]|uniref:kinase-like domain-containing protein n=1 Tax=Halteromyces radiatus TaxID=101107 RepID=UPI0022201816|nr:kinase-like domain-containing protein [Halteromyces radiatus]KAI8092842.1 kinase-like domain-containing protein [Halteromyces radiatus]